MTKLAENKPLLFLLPTDQAVLAAVGAIALRHGQLDNAIRLTIGSVAGISRMDALDSTARMGSKELRELLRKLARQRFGEGTTLLQLAAILEKARRVTEERNKIVHSVWVRELDGDPKIRDDNHQFHPIPGINDLEKVASDLNLIRQELLRIRWDGFLADAINASDPKA